VGTAGLRILNAGQAVLCATAAGRWKPLATSCNRLQLQVRHRDSRRSDSFRRARGPGFNMHCSVLHAVAVCCGPMCPDASGWFCRPLSSVSDTSFRANRAETQIWERPAEEESQTPQ
jgi:hypothetical protein